jgi:hypothetical protein
MAFTEPLASIQTCTRFLGHYMGAKSPRLPWGHRSTIRSPTSDQWLCMSQVTKEGSWANGCALELSQAHPRFEVAVSEISWMPPHAISKIASLTSSWVKSQDELPLRARTILDSPTFWGCCKQNWLNPSACNIRLLTFWFVSLFKVKQARKRPENPARSQDGKPMSANHKLGILG